MGAFGSMSLANKFGIVLGCLIVLAFGAGLIGLFINKRKLAKATKIADLEAAGKSDDREKLCPRKLDEGDLFGVRAMESGYLGGVSQSRPSSAATSPYLSPSSTLVELNGSQRVRTKSATSSVFDLSALGPRVSSMSIIASPAPARHKPSPLRLQPSDAELGSRRSHDAAVNMGVYMPPSPSPRTPTTPGSTSKVGWVPPLDVHFSRPSTPNPNPSTRPNSYLPRLAFPSELGKTVSLVPSPSGSVLDIIDSESASIESIPREISPAPPTGPEPLKAPFLSTFPPMAPSRAARQERRSIFPMSDEPRPTSLRKPNDSENTPVRSLIAQSENTNLKREPTIPTLPDFLITRPHLPVHLPHGESHLQNQRQRDLIPPIPSSNSLTQKRSTIHSIAASSMYSATSDSTSVLNFPFTRSSRQQSHSRSRSRSTESQHSRKRPSSTHTLQRTNDSVRGRHSRKFSHDKDRQDKNGKEEKRRSRDRDQIHYDPTSHHRNRSGSVQGRPVDFDHPRESPFRNKNGIHSASSSESSLEVKGIRMRLPAQKHESLVNRDRNGEGVKMDILTVGGHWNGQERRGSATSSGRNRSASEGSQSSIGDYYDTYYRNTLLTQRGSTASLVNRTSALNGGGSGNGSGVEETSVVGRRPGPLNLGLATAIIVEVVTPTLSPMLVERDIRR